MSGALLLDTKALCERCLNNVLHYLSTLKESHGPIIN